MLSEFKKISEYPTLETPVTIRLGFYKKGALQYISHLDLQRTFQRILSRGGHLVLQRQDQLGLPREVLAAALLMLQHGGDAAGEGVQTADHRRVRVGLQGTPGGHAALLRPRKSPLWVSRPGSP